jgi:hypothetical protein
MKNENPLAVRLGDYKYLRVVFVFIVLFVPI